MIKKNFLLLFLVMAFALPSVLSQNPSSPPTGMDSLKLILQNAKHDSTRCNALNAMIEEESDDGVWPEYNQQLKLLAETNLKKHTSSDPLHAFFQKHLADAINNLGYLANLQGQVDQALHYFERALVLEEQIDNKVGIISSLNNIGSLEQSMGKIDKALQYFTKSLGISQSINDKRGMAESHNNIGRIYNEQGDVSAAFENYLLSLKLMQEINDKKGWSISLNNLGAIYQKQGDTLRALSYYERSLKLQEEIKDVHGMAGSLHNIGHVYFKQGKLTEAKNYFTKGLQISEASGNKEGMAHCLNSLALLYYQQGNYTKALENFKLGLHLFESINDKQGITSTLNQIAGVLYKLGEIPNAQQYCEKSLKLALELGFPDDIKVAAGSLCEIYSKTGDWKKAFNMLQLNKRMNDSLMNEANQRAAIQKTFQFEYEKKVAADSIKNSEQRKVFQAEIKQEKTRRTSLYFGIGLLAIFAIFMYNRFRITNKQKHIIEVKEQETQLQKNIIEEKHKEISDSINYAERIQRSFLATDILLRTYLKDYFIFFKPKAIVSGDFYWAAPLLNGRFAFVVADSTGHGVPGAIMSLLNITSLEKAIEQSSEPSEILNQTRQIIIHRLKNDGSVEGGKDGMDGTLMCFDFKNKQLDYAAANNPVWVVRNQTLLEFEADKMPVGKHQNDHLPFKQQTIQLQADDVIYALTDGLPDQFGGPKGKKFMYKRLKEFLLSIAHLNMQEQERQLANVLAEWKAESEQVDDITVVGIRI